MYYLKYPLTGPTYIRIFSKEIVQLKKKIIFSSDKLYCFIILKITNLHLLTFMTREHIPWINSLSFIKGTMSGDFKSQKRAALFLFCFAVFLCLKWPSPLFSFFKQFCWIFRDVLGLPCCVGFPLVVANESYYSLQCTGFSLQWLLVRTQALWPMPFGGCSTWPPYFWFPGSGTQA